MTCIVAIREGGHVWMGGDACVTVGPDVHRLARPKVFRRTVQTKDHGMWPVLIGSAGSLRLENVLEHQLELPDIEEGTVERWMSTAFVDALRATLEAAGLKKHESGVDELEDAVLLVGVAGRLLTVSCDFSVMETYGDERAIGSGEDFARGSLYTSGQLGGWRPIERIDHALRAAARYTSGVSGPFTVISTDNEFPEAT